MLNLHIDKVTLALIIQYPPGGSLTLRWVYTFSILESPLAIV